MPGGVPELQQFTHKTRSNRNEVLSTSQALFKYFHGDLLRRKSSGVISEPCSRQLAALRADSHLEKGRSPPRPLRLLGSGGTESALRLVTCWSSDALRLSSSGRTGQKSAPLSIVQRLLCAKRNSSASKSTHFRFEILPLFTTVRAHKISLCSLIRGSIPACRPRAMIFIANQ